MPSYQPVKQSSGFQNNYKSSFPSIQNIIYLILLLFIIILILWFVLSKTIITPAAKQDQSASSNAANSWNNQAIKQLTKLERLDIRGLGPVTLLSSNQRSEIRDSKS